MDSSLFFKRLTRLGNQRNLSKTKKKLKYCRSNEEFWNWKRLLGCGLKFKIA